MPTEFRASKQEDLPAISELMRSAFDSAPGAPYLNADLLRWKYFEVARSYVLDRDGRIVAHGCAWPVPNLQAICLIDWASAKDAPGMGILLARKICQTVPVTLSIGGSEMTQKIMPKIGFVKKGELLTYARVLRPWKQFRTRPGSKLKGFVQFGRNLFWSLAPAALPVGLQAVAQPAPAMWRSVTPYEMEGSSFSMSRIGGQSRIVSLKAPSVSLVRTYAAAVSTAFEDPEACEIIAVAHDGQTRRALLENGFRERRRRSVFVSDPHGALDPESYPLPLDMLADDMFYMNVPEDPYLT